MPLRGAPPPRDARGWLDGDEGDDGGALDNIDSVLPKQTASCCYQLGAEAVPRLAKALA